MLEKGAIQKVVPTQEQFLNNLQKHLVINYKNLNKFIPCKHFKMEVLHCLVFLLEQDGLLCKIDLKNLCFSVPLNNISQKFARFQWSGNKNKFFCLCLGFGPGPRSFTKLLKVPVAVLRRVNIGIIVYLDEMLLMGSTLPEILMVRDTQSFCITTFGFCDQPQKISPSSCETNRVSELSNSYRELTLALSEKDMFINMRHFLAILWTFELLLNFD